MRVRRNLFVLPSSTRRVNAFMGDSAFGEHQSPSHPLPSPWPPLSLGARCCRGCSAEGSARGGGQGPGWGTGTLPPPALGPPHGTPASSATGCNASAAPRLPPAGVPSAALAPGHGTACAALGRPRCAAGTGSEGGRSPPELEVGGGPEATGALRLPEARGCCRVVEALHASLPAGMEDLVCPKNQVLCF